MKKFFNQNLIILGSIIFFVASVFILSFFSQKQQEAQKDFWVVYFSDPKSQDVSFIIENQQKEKEFRYEIWNDSEKSKENMIFLKKGEKKKIEVPEEKGQGKILVKVFSGSEKQEIYKN